MPERRARRSGSSSLWQTEQTCSHSSWPSSMLVGVGGALGDELLVLGRAGRPSPSRASSCAGSRRGREQRRGVDARGRLEPRVVRAGPGIASILPPSCGTHQLWRTSVSGAKTSSWTTLSAGAIIVPDRDRAVRVVEHPVELAPLDPDRRLVGGARSGRVRDRRQLDEDEGRRSPPRISTGTTVQRISSRVEPWSWRPSALRGRFPRRYLTMNAISAPSTPTKTMRGEDHDEAVALADARARSARRPAAGATPPFPARAAGDEDQCPRAREPEYEGSPSHAFGIV